MTGRNGILTVFGAFVAPFLLAFIVLKMGWFNAGQTNKGEFMDRELTLSWLLPDQAAETEWIIFYPMPQHCEQTCNNVLYSLNQGYQALGKLQKKAHPVVVLNDSTGVEDEMLGKTYPFVKLMAHTPSQQATLSQLSSDFMYLVDPFGKVVLRYSAKAQKEEMIMVTKDWMEDLKRLLKYARTS